MATDAARQAAASVAEREAFLVSRILTGGPTGLSGIV